MKFDVTFEIVTEDSAACGDTSEAGNISENSCLRDAIADFRATRTNTVDGYSIQAGDRWITVQNGMDWINGEYESRSLHRPANCTDSSWMRICRILSV